MREDGVIVRELYAHFECIMEMVENYFAESPHKDETEEAAWKALRRWEKEQKKRAEEYIEAIKRQEWWDKMDEKKEKVRKEKEKSLKRKAEEENVRNGKKLKAEGGL